MTESKIQVKPTLEEYLRNLKKEDETTYEVSFKMLQCQPDRLCIMLHPKDRDGQTVDFIVKGNKLEPRFDENGIERE